MNEGRIHRRSRTGVSKVYMETVKAVQITHKTTFKTSPRTHRTEEQRYQKTKNEEAL